MELEAFKMWLSCSFQMNKKPFKCGFTLGFTLGGIHEQKWGKAMFKTDKKYTRCKRLACHVALKYCLKDSPCCTEWIDVCYKCIRDLIWMSMEPLHVHRRAFINAHEIATLKQSLKLTYLTNGYKTKPSIIKRRFLPVNTAISRLINSPPSVMN